MSREPRQLQRAVNRFIDDVTPAMADVVDRLPKIDGRRLEQDVATEVFNLVAALVDVDRSHTDDELWGVIFAFHRWLPGELGLAKPDDLRRSHLFVDRARWIREPSAMLQILTTADARFGTTHSRTYYDRAMAVAFTVAALDDVPTRAEMEAIDELRNRMLVELGDLPASPLTPGGPPDGGESLPAADKPADAPGTAGETKKPDDEELPPPRPIEELLAELDELVGLERVKTEVRLVTNLLRVQQLREERNLPTTAQSRHLVFTGNPGTGKTTVARLLAAIYRSLGVVAKGQLIETDRSGMVSGFVGQTALKVMEVADRAEGGVLLIDEAYALARGGENDFGREAIDTLVKVIEDRRDSLVVIAAGYPVEMADFIGANPGLASRFPKTIDFPDYTDDELWRIFSTIGDDAGYHPDADAEAKVRAWFTSIPRDKGFGNGRLARNLFEDAVARQASRVVAIEEPTDDQLTTLTAVDIAEIGEGPRHGNADDGTRFAAVTVPVADTEPHETEPHETELHDTDEGTDEARPGPTGTDP